MIKEVEIRFKKDSRDLTVFSIGDLIEELGGSLDCMFLATNWTVQLDLGNDGNIIVFKDKELICALVEAYNYKKGL